MRRRIEWLWFAVPMVAACGDPAASADVLVVHEVTVVPASLSLPLLDEAQLEATAWTASGLEIPNRPVTWFSHDSDIATVSSEGLVTAVRPGRTEIVARADDVTRAVPVNVTASPVAWIVVEPDRFGLKVGESRKLEVFLFSFSGTPLTGRDVEFESDDPGVAIVSSAGLVVAVEPGDARITARVDDKSAVARVSVRR
jgi:alpha-amylase